MKTKRILSALALTIIATFSVNTQTTYAQQITQLSSATDLVFLKKEPAKKPLSAFPIPEKPVEKPAPQQVVHEVIAGDNLTKIAEANKSTWLRLWQKNMHISDPDVLKIGEKITVPLDTEKLDDRPLPAPVVIVPNLVAFSPTTVQPRGGSAGNTYSYGYCTWYVKNRRPDLPNNLGNAETWYARAAAQGIPVGSTPRVGAVGTQGNHVVYVEAVNGDGTILISEMNYKGWNVQSSRTASASSFNYIY